MKSAVRSQDDTNRMERGEIIAVLVVVCVCVWIYFFFYYMIGVRRCLLLLCC